jgi:hypothetical protein
VKWIEKHNNLTFLLVISIANPVIFVILDSLVTNVFIGDSTGIIIIQNLLRVVIAAILIWLYFGIGIWLLNIKKRNKALVFLGILPIVYIIVLLTLDKRLEYSSKNKGDSIDELV